MLVEAGLWCWSSWIIVHTQTKYEVAFVISSDIYTHPAILIDEMKLIAFTKWS